ncbi:MAG: DUF4344 domain-containing metallopeptidase [Longimicrobiales bacterium]
MTPHRPRWPLALPLALLALLPALVAAQTAITPGRAVTAQLAASDPTLSDGSHYHLYQYRGRAGEQIQITMRSDAFDTYLAGGVMQSGNLDAADTDDDSAGGTDSQLTVTVGASGTYVIRANSLRAAQTGEYTLLVEVVGASTASSAAVQVAGGQIAAGQTVNGRLDTSDPTLGDGSRYDVYTYRGRPGEQITVVLRSSDFDAYLAGGTPQGANIEAEETNDDGAGGTDAMISATVPASGIYGIRANSYSASGSGAYTLTVEVAGAVAAGGARTVAVGQTVASRLQSSTPTLGDGSHFETYYLDARAGDRIFVTMTSSDFDAYLRWGREQAGRFESISFDDDGGGGTNARLEVTIDAAGRYAIQANSFGADATGAYSLSVESATGGTGGLPAVALGQSVSGRLDASDPMLGDNSHYEVFAYQGRAGEQVLVTMRSGDFDAYLAVGRLVGGSFESTETNDDGGGGTDSQILATLPADGVLAIRANSLRAGQTGAFTVSVASASAGRTTTPPNVPAGTRVVSAGQSVSGALRASDPMMADSSFYNDYVYSGAPGDRVRVTLTSGEFDAFLQWGRVQGDRFTSDAHDDDGAGGTNAAVEAVVDGTGTYAIRVNSFGAGETGAYTLAVERLTGPAPTPASAPVSGSAGKWHFAYVDSPNPEYRPLSQLAKQWGVLEQIASDMAARFLLPRDIDLAFDECGMINAFYDPNATSITFCYELLSLLQEVFVPDGNWTQEAQDQVSGAIWFIMMHEVGHALVDVLDLPITGREEDVADQLAVVTLMEAGDKGANAAYAGTLAIQPSTTAFEQYEFADEHSLGPVRLFNVLCWIYGSDPTKYEPIVTDGHLPEERAVRCPSEWDRMSKSWQRILQPHTP